MEKTAYQPRVVRGRTELLVLHNSKEIAFASPSVGPNTYQKVGQEILKNEQRVPTGDYTASLLHPVYCNDSAAKEPEFINVKEGMKSWLWVFNRNLWTSRGVYVLQDENAIGRSETLFVEALEKMLNKGEEISGIRFSKDSKLRFAPKGSYVLGSRTPEEFAKDGFIIASCGQEGAEKLGEVSAKFRTNPYINGVDVTEKQTPEQRVSAVCGGVGRLAFDGYGWVDCVDCCAFGVWK